jgi:hypothetical protein
MPENKPQHVEFFAKYGRYKVDTHYVNVMRTEHGDITIEEMYQQFKARLLEEMKQE